MYDCSGNNISIKNLQLLSLFVTNVCIEIICNQPEIKGTLLLILYKMIF